MRRWLARASLDVFFKLIEEHALEAHWRYRQAFWLAYLQKGIISDAWLGSRKQIHDPPKRCAILVGHTAG